MSLFADAPGGRQRADDMAIARLLDVRLDEALEHEFRAVGVKRNDHMEKLHSRCCRVL
jgi:hypothetical protein